MAPPAGKTSAVVTRTVAVEGAELYTERRGSGPPLVLIPGGLGDGWLLYGGLGMDHAQTADAIAELKQAFTNTGRDAAMLDLCDEVTPRNGDIAQSMEEIPALAQAGITTVRLHLRRFMAGPDEALPKLEEVVRRFEPYREA